MNILQVRGAVTVVALVGVTWVAGAFTIGYAALPLAYLFCITTPLQGLIIFIVRVAQHAEARSAWVTLMKTGSFRKSYTGTIPSHTHSSTHTNSSGHTHSTASTGDTPPKSTLSSVLKSENRFFRGLSHKSTPSMTHTSSTLSTCSSGRRSRVSLDSSGLVSHRKSVNGYGHRRSASEQRRRASMSEVMGRFMGRFRSKSHCGIDPRVSTAVQKHNLQSRRASEGCRRHLNIQHISRNDPNFDPIKNSQKKNHIWPPISKDPPTSINHKDPNNPWDEVVSELASGSMNRTTRPRSLFVMKSDHYSNTLGHSHSTHSQFPGSPPTFIPQSYVATRVPPPKVPTTFVPSGTCRSLGSIANGQAWTGDTLKEGDDSSWHFVRQPPDGMSAPVSEGEGVDAKRNRIKNEKTIPNGITNHIKQCDDFKIPPELSNRPGVVSLGGQQVIIDQSFFNVSQMANGHLPRASSEHQMFLPEMSKEPNGKEGTIIRRCISTEQISPTTNQWEDPRVKNA